MLDAGRDWRSFLRGGREGGIWTMTSVHNKMPSMMSKFYFQNCCIFILMNYIIFYVNSDFLHDTDPEIFFFLHLNDNHNEIVLKIIFSVVFF